MKKINEIKKLLPNNIEESLLISAIFDVSRKYDNLFIKELKKIKKEIGITIDSIERNKLRKAYYYSLPNKYNLKFSYNDTQLSEVLDDFIARLKTYDSNTIITSLEKRIEDVGSNRINNNTKDWLNIYTKKRKKWDYSLLIFKINQELFSKLNYSFDKLTSFISNTYDKLENYRYLTIIFEDNLFNKNGKDITWQVIYKLSVFSENFIQFNGKFFPFHKEKQIERLSKFLKERNIDDSEKLSLDFYKNISCGFKFEDCYLSDDLSKKILVLKKIELDEIKPSNRKYPYVDFKPDREPGKEILQVKNISKTVEGVKILDKISFNVKQNDKIAFLADNENAKTVLFQIIAGEIEPDEGELVWGTTITKSYFPKDNGYLFETDENVTEWLRKYSKDPDETYVRSFLGRMLFSGDEALKKANVLSGGEKVRCVLSKMMLSGANFLIFDEPTNHLDITAIEWLEKYLKNYPRAVVIVSHDRMFLDRIVDKVYEIEYASITEYKGNYTTFENQKRINYEKQLKDYEYQQAEIKRLQAIADRFRYKPTKAKMALSKLKKIEQMTIIEEPNKYDLKQF